MLVISESLSLPFGDFDSYCIVGNGMVTMMIQKVGVVLIKKNYRTYSTVRPRPARRHVGPFFFLEAFFSLERQAGRSEHSNYCRDGARASGDVVRVGAQWEESTAHTIFRSDETTGLYCNSHRHQKNRTGRREREMLVTLLGYGTSTVICKYHTVRL